MWVLFMDFKMRWWIFFSIYCLIFKCYIFRSKDFKRESMLNHKPKPLILQIRKPLAYSLGSVCPSTLPLMLNPGLYRNRSKSPCVILLDSCHLQIIGFNVSPLDFSQACPSIRAYISPWNHFNSALSGTFPELFSLCMTALCCLNLGFSILSFPQIPVAILVKLFHIALIFTHNQAK